MKIFPKSTYLCTVSGDPQGVIRAMSGTLATAFVGIICTKVARDSVDGSLFCILFRVLGIFGLMDI